MQISKLDKNIETKGGIQHVFLVGAKSLGAYGGYETFVYKLTEYHQNNNQIKYHVVCKANGEGCQNETALDGCIVTAPDEFRFHNAHCHKIKIPQIGHAQAIYYDVASLNWCCNYIESNHIQNSIVYIMACRIGPFIPYLCKRIHQLGGRIYLNPDGHEWMRTKWPAPIRWYWKWSESIMVRYSDLVICDSINIEKYIHEQYDGKGRHDTNPQTTYIAYGADMTKSTLTDDDPRLLSWYQEHGLSANNYYLSVGRFVPENSFEVMIREFMQSNTRRNLAIITGPNPRFKSILERKLHFSSDPRIKFVGTVYDQELLKKIRENAYAYFHGHTVGGTNPSLIESLSSTKLNLLVDVGFNQEVAEDGALYWSRENGSLASLIDKADNLTPEQIKALAEKAKNRASENYTWQIICDEYENVFLNRTKYTA